MTTEIAEPRLTDAVAAAGVRFGTEALRALLAQLPVAVLLADRQGRIVYANAHARRASIVGRAALPEPVGWALARALLTGEVVRDEELELADASGAARWAGLSITPVANAAGEIETAVLTLVDLTDRKRREAWEPLVESLARL
jgi:PAS domain-containing protein